MSSLKELQLCGHPQRKPDGHHFAGCIVWRGQSHVRSRDGHAMWAKPTSAQRHLPQAEVQLRCTCFHTHIVSFMLASSSDGLRTIYSYLTEDPRRHMTLSSQLTVITPRPSPSCAEFGSAAASLQVVKLPCLRELQKLFRGLLMALLVRLLDLCAMLQWPIGLTRKGPALPEDFREMLTLDSCPNPICGFAAEKAPI